MRRLVLFLVLAAGPLPAVAQTNPVKIAALARFDLLGDTNAGPLTNGYMSVGGRIRQPLELAGGGRSARCSANSRSPAECPSR